MSINQRQRTKQLFKKPSNQVHRRILKKLFGKFKRIATSQGALQICQSIVLNHHIVELFNSLDQSNLIQLTSCLMSMKKEQGIKDFSEEFCESLLKSFSKKRVKSDKDSDSRYMEKDEDQPNVEQSQSIKLPEKKQVKQKMTSRINIKEKSTQNNPNKLQNLRTKDRVDKKLSQSKRKDKHVITWGDQKIDSKEYQEQSQLSQLSNEKKNSGTQGLRQNIIKSNQSFFSQESRVVMSQQQLNNKNLGNKKKNLSWIRENIIGFNTSYVSNLGLQLEAIYVDHTATNRPFKQIEILVQHAKLYSANPHTEFSTYGKFSTQLMHYSRDSLLNIFNGKDHYTVLPTGAGSTGAIEKAIRLIKTFQNTDKGWQNPKIFVTPYQHHSNILPWIQFYKDVEVLVHSKQGTLHVQNITKQLSQCPCEYIIVTISAASNVTSKLTHLKEINDVIKHISRRTSKKIIFCVDCAAYCCHHDLDLKIYDRIDFAFLSPHKNLGGTQSCGVLLARKSILLNSKPTFPGGGTVMFVKGYSSEDVMYESDVFSREIAGTPPYLGFYRAALSFQLLKQSIGYNYIHQRQTKNTKLFFEKINTANAKMSADNLNKFILLYGEADLDQRANVVSFNILKKEKDSQKVEHLKHSIISLILANLFGIQVRSGCFCAGPYGIQLLQLNEQNIVQIKDEVQADIKINKPGFLRLDLTFYLEDYEIEYIANSIQLLARYWENLQYLYAIFGNGQVQPSPMFKQYQKPNIYSLTQFKAAQQKLNQQNANEKDKLQNRRKTLEKQFKTAEQICRNRKYFQNKSSK